MCKGRCHAQRDGGIVRRNAIHDVHTTYSPVGAIIDRPLFLHKKEDTHTNVLHGIRRRPTLPGRFQPSTISVLRLNFCVRDGNRWIPQAIVTGNMGAVKSVCYASRLSRFAPPSLPFPRTLKTAQVRFRFPSPDQGALPLLASTFSLRLPLPFRLRFSHFISSDQALDRLVSPSSIRYRTSTDDLSSLSSSRGLTCS